MIDAHCHLNFHVFEKDYDRVIKDAQAAGIKAIINAGTQVSSSVWAVDLARRYEDLYAVIAIHPHHADKVAPTWRADLEAIARDPKVIGIGECGLDYYNYQSNGIVDPELQKKVFIEHLELARKLKLPLQIHSRDENARKDLLEILYSHKNSLQTVPGMFHCMAGSKKSLKKVLDLGFYVGFDGNITYESLPPGEPLPLVELIKYAPLDRMTIETDSPYLTPLPFRRQRNEPKYAIITAEFIAKVKGVSFEKVVEQTDKNVYTIFTRIKSNR
jgi:TatD DNase family protein